MAEASNTATLLENNLVTTEQQLSQIEQFFWKGKSLQKFGEICVMIHHDTKHRAKLSNQGIAGICV